MRISDLVPNMLLSFPGPPQHKRALRTTHGKHHNGLFLCYVTSLAPHTTCSAVKVLFWENRDTRQLALPWPQYLTIPMLVPLRFDGKPSFGNQVAKYTWGKHTGGLDGPIQHPIYAWCRVKSLFPLVSLAKLHVRYARDTMSIASEEKWWCWHLYLC